MPHVLIAGAGIGGLAAALSLSQAGAEVSLFERAPALDAAGAGVQLSPNATRILRRLGVLDELAAVSLRPEGVRVRSARSGRDLAFMPLDVAETRWGAPYLLAHRADLQRVLAEAVAQAPGVTLHLGSTLAGFGANESGVKATIKKDQIGRSVAGDILIGADGIRSTVRAKLADRDDPPRETGCTAWRALVPAEAAAPLFDRPETGLWLGRDGHLVHYPLNNGRLINVVATVRDTATAANADLWSAPGDPAMIAARFSTWHRAARDLIAAAPAWSTWPLFDRAPLAAWHAGRVALLGDAAHPILPFLAQGAAQAIEDASVLAACLAATRDLPQALADYSQKRQARALKVQETSRSLGRTYHLAGPSAVARNLGMRTLGGRRLLTRYDWLYRA